MITLQEVLIQREELVEPYWNKTDALASTILIIATLVFVLGYIAVGLFKKKKLRDKVFEIGMASTLTVAYALYAVRHYCTHMYAILQVEPNQGSPDRTSIDPIFFPCYNKNTQICKISRGVLCDVRYLGYGRIFEGLLHQGPTQHDRGRHPGQSPIRRPVH